jgi:C-terminal peptidase prc
LLTSAVEISNLFLTNGLIVAGEDKDKHEQWKHEAIRNHAPIAMAQVPVIVLVNKGSASASEIVAGALQAHGAAIILGERTYGKGSVQTVSQLGTETFLKLTTQYYRLPPTTAERARGEAGKLVHKRPGAHFWGVDPDLVVTCTPDQIQSSYDLRQDADLVAPAIGEEVQERPDVNDLITKGLDPQLETALLLLQVRALGGSEMKHVRLN